MTHFDVGGQDVEEEEEDEEEHAGAELRTGGDADDGEVAKEEGLHPQEIDAYWLQRQITRAYGDTIDADESQRLAELVLETLQVCFPRFSTLACVGVMR